MIKLGATMSLIEPTTISRLTDRHIGSPEDTPGPPQVVSAGLPTPITVAVSPVRPGHTVAVEYRSCRGAMYLHKVALVKQR
jgi:hypothetical protein